MIKNIVIIALVILMSISIGFNIFYHTRKSIIPNVRIPNIALESKGYVIDTIPLIETRINVIDSIRYSIRVTHNPITLPLYRDSLKNIVFYKNDSTIEISGNITEDSLYISKIDIKENLQLSIKTDTNLLSIHYMVYPSTTNPNILFTDPLPVYKHKKERKYVKIIKTVFTILATAIVVNQFHS